MVPNGSDPSPSRIVGTAYHLYLCAFVLLMIGFKLWIASDIKASAAFCDDYNYMIKSYYYIRANFEMVGYPHPYGNLFAGVLYPVVIAPWLLWDDPHVRIFVVHVINILLSAVTVYFGSRAVAQLSNARSLLAPICLASFACVFLFSFYALTENLVFALLSVMGWLVLDFERTCKSRGRLGLLIALTALLPLTRPPGLAVYPALLVLVVLNRKALGLRRTALTGLAFTVAAIGPYLLFMALSPSATKGGAVREAAYVELATRMVLSPEHFLVLCKLMLNQLYYLFLATGCWVLPVLLVMALQIRGLEPGPAKRQWLNYGAFMAVTGFMLLAFCLLQLARSIRFDLDRADLIVGRYSDPIGLLVTIGGLAAIMALRRPTRFQAFILRIAAPVFLCFAIARVWGGEWATISQSGLLMLCGAFPEPTVLHLALFVILVTLLAQWLPPAKWRVPILMLFFFVFNIVSDERAIRRVTRPRALLITHSLEAANWVNANLPEDSRIGYDWSVSKRRAPNGWGTMADVYRGMMCTTCPRSAVLVRRDEHIHDCDYLYSTANAPNPWGLQTIWSNGDYALFRVDPGVEVFLHDPEAG